MFSSATTEQGGSSIARQRSRNNGNVNVRKRPSIESSFDREDECSQEVDGSLVPSVGCLEACVVQPVAPNVESSPMPRGTDADTTVTMPKVGVVLRCRSSNSHRDSSSNRHHQVDRKSIRLKDDGRTPMDGPVQQQQQQTGGEQTTQLVLTDGTNSYGFDHVLPLETSDQELFDRVMRPALDQLISGSNTAILTLWDAEPEPPESSIGAGRHHSGFHPTMASQLMPMLSSYLFDGLRRVETCVHMDSGSNDGEGQAKLGSFTVSISVVEFIKNKMFYLAQDLTLARSVSDLSSPLETSWEELMKGLQHVCSRFDLSSNPPTHLLTTITLIQYNPTREVKMTLADVRLPAHAVPAVSRQSTDRHNELNLDGLLTLLKLVTGSDDSRQERSNRSPLMSRLEAVWHTCPFITLVFDAPASVCAADGQESCLQGGMSVDRSNGEAHKTATSKPVQADKIRDSNNLQMLAQSLRHQIRLAEESRAYDHAFRSGHLPSLPPLMHDVATQTSAMLNDHTKYIAPSSSPETVPDNPDETGKVGPEWIAQQQQQKEQLEHAIRLNQALQQLQTRFGIHHHAMDSSGEDRSSTLDMDTAAESLLSALQAKDEALHWTMAHSDALQSCVDILRNENRSLEKQQQILRHNIDVLQRDLETMQADAAVWDSERATFHQTIMDLRCQAQDGGCSVSSDEAVACTVDGLQRARAQRDKSTEPQMIESRQNFSVPDEDWRESAICMQHWTSMRKAAAALDSEVASRMQYEVRHHQLQIQRVHQHALQSHTILQQEIVELRGRLNESESEILALNEQLALAHSKLDDSTSQQQERGICLTQRQDERTAQTIQIDSVSDSMAQADANNHNHLTLDVVFPRQLDRDGAQHVMVRYPEDGRQNQGRLNGIQFDSVATTSTNVRSSDERDAESDDLHATISSLLTQLAETRAAQQAAEMALEHSPYGMHGALWRWRATVMASVSEVQQRRPSSAGLSPLARQWHNNHHAGPRILRRVPILHAQHQHQHGSSGVAPIFDPESPSIALQGFLSQKRATLASIMHAATDGEIWVQRYAVLDANRRLLTLYDMVDEIDQSLVLKAELHFDSSSKVSHVTQPSTGDTLAAALLGRAPPAHVFCIEAETIELSFTGARSKKRTIHLQCNNARECTVWVDAILTLIARCNVEKHERAKYVEQRRHLTLPQPAHQHVSVASRPCDTPPNRRTHAQHPPSRNLHTAAPPLWAIKKMPSACDRVGDEEEEEDEEDEPKGIIWKA